MRSVLTILGIVIGVATVVALLSIGNGATASITDSIQSGGSNLLTISPGRQQTAMPGMGQSQTASYLYYSDYELLERTLTGEITSIVPLYQSSYTVKFGDESFTSPISGVMEDHAQARSFTVMDGTSSPTATVNPYRGWRCLVPRWRVTCSLFLPSGRLFPSTG
ncbi:MAG: ABC transporter permease [Anaerolineales bacterium]|nr:ABC transporter permease [Anaerolineales bacterium]